MKLYHAVSISILIHLVLVLGLKVAGYEFKFEEKQPKQYVEFRDEDDSKKPLPGEETKRVEKEMRRRETSPSELSAPVKPTPRSMQTKNAISPDPSLGKKLRTVSPSDDDVFMQAANNASNFRQQLQNFLPRDLEIGDIEALNTDRNLFFSFYSRMAQKVVYPWAMNVVNGFEKMKATGRLGGQRRAWITILEVILDKNGNLVSTQPLQLAGDWDIDDAPIKAFKQAKSFPNPPAEMVEEDGYIRIRYKFLVYYNPM